MQEAFMRQAVALALESVITGRGGPFGAVIVRNGQVVGQGTNQVTTFNDPTAHAEIVAVRQACTALGTFHLSDCEIFSSCEPCPMCLAAIHWARIDRIYFAASRLDAAVAGFDDAFLYQEVAAPLSARRLPIQQILLGEALGPFEAWKTSPHRIDY